MTLDYGIGAFLSLLLDRVPRVRARPSRKVLRRPRNDRHRLAADPRLLRRDRRGDEAARRLHVPRVRGRPATVAATSSDGSSASVIGCRGVDPQKEQTWKQYTFALLAFSASGLIVTYLIQRLQHVLPFNPQHFGAVEPTSAFNTAASFTTNTNWQGYSGESTMSYLTQMAGLAWHNFTSAAAGIGVALALGARLHPPARARRRQDARQLLGRPHPRHRLRVPAAQHRLRPGAGVAGRDPEPVGPTRTSRRSRAPSRRIALGPGRLAGGDQAARHQRRRLLQRQRRAPVREPDAVHELPVDVHDLRDLVGADLHLRSDGARPAARLGDLGRDVDPVLRRRRRLLPLRGAGQPGAGRPARRSERSATWRARRCASASPPRRCTRR